MASAWVGRVREACLPVTLFEHQTAEALMEPLQSRGQSWLPSGLTRIFFCPPHHTFRSSASQTLLAIQVFGLAASEGAIPLGSLSRRLSGDMWYVSSAAQSQDSILPTNLFSPTYQSIHTHTHPSMTPHPLPTHPPVRTSPSVSIHSHVCPPLHHTSIPSSSICTHSQHAICLPIHLLIPPSSHPPTHLPTNLLILLAALPKERDQSISLPKPHAAP